MEEEKKSAKDNKKQCRDWLRVHVGQHNSAIRELWVYKINCVLLKNLLKVEVYMQCTCFSISPVCKCGLSFVRNRCDLSTCDAGILDLFYIEDQNLCRQFVCHFIFACSHVTVNSYTSSKIHARQMVKQ